LEALNVKLVLEKDLNILNHFSLSKTAPNLISKDKDSFNDLVFVVFVILVKRLVVFLGFV
jgi:hypothetical protein